MRTICLILLLSSTASAQDPASFSYPSTEPDRIADNSFLLEEAYNQGEREVQHISAFEHVTGTSGWAYMLEQEWPIGSQEHQFSYSVPLSRIDGSPAAPGIGDISIDYRYQILGVERGDIAIAPRATVTLPTGNAGQGFGNGGMGFELGLPLSIMLTPSVVAHTNASFGVTPNAKIGDQEFSLTSVLLGQSFIWLASENFNIMLEGIYERESSTMDDLTTSEDAMTISPGIRWAHNFDSGLQIVPGIAAPISFSNGEEEIGLFLYLSFEHGF
jgi:hypothetical protein